jgi:hypothetical protein
MYLFLVVVVYRYGVVVAPERCRTVRRNAPDCPAVFQTVRAHASDHP